MSLLDKLHRNENDRDQRPEAELKKLFKGKDKSREHANEQEDGNAIGRLARVALGNGADAVGKGVEKLQGKVDDFQADVQGNVDDVQGTIDDVQATAKKKFPGKGEKVHKGVDAAQAKVNQGVEWGQGKVDQGQAAVQTGVDKVLDPIKTPKAKKQQQEAKQEETESAEIENAEQVPEQPEKKKKKGLFGALAKVGIKPEINVGGFEIGIDDEKVSVDGKAGNVDLHGEQQYGKGKKLGRDAKGSANGTVGGVDVNVNAHGTEDGVAGDVSASGNVRGVDLNAQQEFGKGKKLGRDAKGSASGTVGGVDLNVNAHGTDDGVAGDVSASGTVKGVELSGTQEFGKGKQLGRDASVEAKAEVLGFPVKGGIDGKDVFKDGAEQKGKLETAAEGMSDRDKLARQALDGGMEIAKGDAGWSALAGIADQAIDDSGAAKKQKKPGDRLAEVALANDEDKLAADADKKADKKDADKDEKKEVEHEEDEHQDAKHLPGKVGAASKATKKELEHHGRDTHDFAEASKKKLLAEQSGAHHEKQALVDGHGTGLVVDEKKKLAKTDAKHVDGHGTGLDIDDKHAVKKPGKTDGKHVDGHGTGLEIPGKTDDKHGMGLLIDQDFEHETGEIQDSEGNQVPYKPGKQAPTPQASKGAQPGGFAKPKAPPAPPAVKPQTPTQEAMQAYIDKARKDREAGRATVQAQKLQKSQQVNVDANVIKGQVQAANNAKLAELRKKAEADKAAAAKKAEEQAKAEGPVTIESLKAKLESETTADKERLKQSFESKKSELTIRISTQKQTLQTETQKQIDNWKKQEEDKKKQLQAAFDANKVQWELTAKNAAEQMKKQVADDKKRLEDNKKTLDAKTAERMKDLDARANANATRTLTDGETEAKRLEERGKSLGATEMSKAEGAAASARADGRSKAAGTEDEGQKKAFVAGGESKANDLLAAARMRQADLVAKGQKDGKDTRIAFKAKADDLVEKGKQAIASASTISMNQIKAIDEKIGQLDGLAKERIAKAQTDLDKKVKDGLDGIKKAQDESKGKIDKLKADTEAKLATIEGDAEKKLTADYDKEVAAIDKRVEAARKKLATGNEKDVQALKKMVDQTLQAIDKGIADTEKKFDRTVQDAEQKAQAFVLAQLAKIKAEADQALHAIDKVFDDAMTTLNAMQEQVHRDIEEMSKGKMLELEVHTATMLADLGDKSKLEAVRATIKGYVDAGQPLPAGYAQTAKPAAKLGPDGKPVEEKPAEKKPEDTVAELQKLDPVKAGEPKPGEDKKDERSPEEISNEKVDNAIKQAQAATSFGAHQATQAAIKTQGDDAAKEMKTFVAGKETEQNDLAEGKTEAVEKARKAREAKANGQKAADDLFKAMDGMGTDEKAIYASLKGKSPEEIEAIKEAYKAKTGRDLDKDLASELSDDELKEARALLAGDKTSQRVAAIQNSLSMWGNDKEKIRQTLNGPPALSKEEKEALAKQYEIDTGKRLDQVLADEGIGGITPADFKAKEAALDQAKLDAAVKDQSGTVAAAAQQIINATTGDRLGTNEANVYAALQGKSPEQIEAIKRAFKDKTGKDLDGVLEDEMSGAELKEAKALMSGDPVRIATAKLDNAAHGGIMPGTDKDKIHKTLEDIKDPVTRKQVKEQYEKETGQKLDEMLNDELSGFDRDLAKAYAGGDPANIAAVKADQAMRGGFLTDIADGIADTTGDITGLDIDREIMRKAVGGAVVGVIAGPFAPLVQVLQHTGVTNFGTDTGTDEKALYAALESCPDEYSRMKLREAYKARTGKDLDIELKSELSGAEHDVAKFLMEGDPIAAEAAKMKAAGQGAGTDKKMIYDALQKCKTEDERKALIAKYNELYGKDGENFDAMLKNELAPSTSSRLGWGAIGLLVGGPAGAAYLANNENDLDYQKAKLLSQGKMDDGFALYYAMNEGMLGVGTDDEALKKIIQGPPQKTKAEIAKLKEQYAEAAKKYGGKDNADLFNDVMDETSGRLAHEMEWGLKGKPETPEEIAAKQQADIDFERNDTSWVGEVGCLVLLGPIGYGAMKCMGINANDIGNALTDSWSDSGKNLETSHAEFQAKYAALLADPKYADRNKYPPGSPERIAMDKAMMAELEQFTAVSEVNLKDFQTAKDATADVAGTVVAVAVGAVLTVASGGALGPAAIALISGVAGLGATMAIKGGSMSNEEIGQALVAIVAESMAAGLVDLKAVKGLIGNVSALAGGEKAIAGRIVNEMLEEAIESGAEAMVTAICDPANYKGDPVDWLRNVTAATAKAAGTGAFSAGVSTGLGDKWNPNGPLGKAIKGGTMQMVGGAASSAIDPATYEGSQDEKWGRFAKSQAEAAARGGYNSLGGGSTSHQDPGHDEYSPSSKTTTTHPSTETNTNTESKTAANTNTNTESQTAASTNTNANTDAQIVANVASNANANANLEQSAQPGIDQNEKAKEARRKGSDSDSESQTPALADVHKVLDGMAKGDVQGDSPADHIDANTAEAINTGAVQLAGKSELKHLGGDQYQDPVTGIKITWGANTAAIALGDRVFIDPNKSPADLRRDLRHEVNHALHSSDFDSKYRDSGDGRLHDELRSHLAEAGPNPSPEAIQKAWDDIHKNYPELRERMAMLNPQQVMGQESHGNTINSVRLMPVYDAMQNAQAFGTHPTGAEVANMISKLDSHDRAALSGDPNFQQFLNGNPNLSPVDIVSAWDQLGTSEMPKLRVPTADPAVAAHNSAVASETQRILTETQAKLARGYEADIRAAVAEFVAKGASPEDALAKARIKVGDAPHELTPAQQKHAEELARLKVVNDELEAGLEGKALVDFQEKRGAIERRAENMMPEDLRAMAAQHEADIRAKTEELRPGTESGDKAFDDVLKNKDNKDPVAEFDKLMDPQGRVVDDEHKTGLPDKDLAEYARLAIEKGVPKLFDKLGLTEIAQVMALLEKQAKNGQITHQEMGEAAIKIGTELIKRGIQLAATLAKADPQAGKQLGEMLDAFADGIKQGRPDLIYKLGNAINDGLNKVGEKLQKPGFMENLPVTSDEAIVLDPKRAAQEEKRVADDARLAQQLEDARTREMGLQFLDNAAETGAESDGLVRPLDEAKTNREQLEEKQRRLAAIDDKIKVAKNELELAEITNDPRHILEAQARLDSARAQREHVMSLPNEFFVPAEDRPAQKKRIDTDDLGPALPNQTPSSGQAGVRIAADLDNKQNNQAEDTGPSSAELEFDAERDAANEQPAQLRVALDPNIKAKDARRSPGEATTNKLEQQEQSHPTRKQEIHLGNDTPAAPPSVQAAAIRTELDQLQALRHQLSRPEKVAGKHAEIESKIRTLMGELDTKLGDPKLKDALLDPHVVFALARESAVTNKQLPSSPALKQFLSTNIDAVRAAQDQARQGLNPELRAKREVFEREIAIAILGDDRVKGMVDANLDDMCAKAIDYMNKSRSGSERDQGLAELGIDPSKKAYAGAVSTGKDTAANAAIMMEVLREGNVRERMIALGAFAELVARDMAMDPAKFEAVAASATGAKGEFSAQDVAGYRARLLQFMADTGGFKGDPKDEKEVKKFFGSFLKPTSVEKSGDQKAYQTAKGQEMDAKIPSVFMDDTDAANPLAPTQSTGAGEDSSLARSSLTIAQAQALGMNLSKREIAAAEANGGRLPLNIGAIANVVDPSADFIQQGSASSMPQKAGISGTTFRFMEAATLLGGDPKMSRLAMIGALQAIDAHTIYEIAHAAAGFGTNGEMAFNPERPYDNLGIDPDVLAEIARNSGTSIDELNGGITPQASESSSSSQATLPANANSTTEQKTEQKNEQAADHSNMPATAESARERKEAGESWTNLEVRNYYNARNSEIAALDVQWQAEGKSIEERARLASALRHGMRMTARAMMGDDGQVLELLLRDAKKYGDGEGPTFEELIQDKKDKGLTGDAIFEAILGTSGKTDKKTNEKVAKGEDKKPDVKIPEGVTIRGDYATVLDANGSEVVVRIKGEPGNTQPYMAKNTDGTWEVRFGKDLSIEEALQAVANQLGAIQSQTNGNTGASSGMMNKESSYGGNELARDNSRNVRAGVNGVLPSIGNLFPPGSVTTVGPNRVAITVGGASHLVDINVISGSLPVASDVANFDMTTTPITITLSGTILDEHVERALSHEISEIRSLLEQGAGGKVRSANHNALASDSSATALSHDDIGKVGELRVLTNDLKSAAARPDRAHARAELIRLLKELGMLNSDGDKFNSNGLGKQRQRLLEAEGVDLASLGALLGFDTDTKRPNDPTLPLRGAHADESAVPRVDVTAAEVKPLLRADVIAAFAEFGLAEESVIQYIIDHHNDRSQQRYLADLEGLERQHNGALNSTDVMLIDLYTTKLFYKELNTRLRTGENRDATIKLAKLLNISLAKLPAITGDVFRSLSIKSDDMADFLAKHTAGKNIQWDSYSSVASTLGGTFHKDNVVFIVNNATAYDITDFADGMAYKETPNPGRELLVPAGASLKVVSAKEVSPGKWHITLEQTGSGSL